MPSHNATLKAQLIPLRRAIREGDVPGVNLQLALGVQPVPSCLELAVRRLHQSVGYIPGMEAGLDIIEQLVAVGTRLNTSGTTAWHWAQDCFTHDVPRRLRLWTALIQGGVRLSRQTSPRQGTALQQVLRYLQDQDPEGQYAKEAMALIQLIVERGVPHH